MAFTYDTEKDALFKRGETKKAREMVGLVLKTNKHSMEELAEISGLSLAEVKQIAEGLK